MKNDNNEVIHRKSKIDIFYIILLNSYLVIDEQSIDPICKLINNYKEMKTVLNRLDTFSENTSKINITKFIYFNLNNIHKILYKNEEFITIKNDKKKISFSVYFYLILLIEYEKDLVNYKYSIDFIRDLNTLNKNNNNEVLKQFVISKIIIILIDNYRQIDSKEDYNEEELKVMEDENNGIINKNKNLIKNLNIVLNDDITEIKDMYAEIIISLIQNNISDEYFILNIINQLELENISITKTILDKLNSNFDNIKNFKNDYLILGVNDLLCDKKINFYYILLKFIYKNSIYIYQIPFLLKTRKVLLEALKTNKNKLISLKGNNEKIEYILRKLFDSEFYYQKYLNYKLKGGLNYYNDSNEIIPNNRNRNTNIVSNNNNNVYNALNKNINSEEKEDHNNQIIIRAVKSETNNEKLEISSNSIFSQVDIFSSISLQNENSDNIIEIDEKEDSNQNDDRDINDKLNINISNIEYIKDKFLDLLPFKKEKDKHIILKVSKIIAINNPKLELIKELDNGFYIIEGIDNTLILCDSCFNILIKIDRFEDSIKNVYESSFPGKKSEEIQIICLSKETYSIIINTQTKEIRQIFKNLELKNINSFLKISSENYLFCSENGCFISNDPFNFNSREEDYTFLNNNSYKGIIKINESIVAMASNSCVKNGVDELIFCNVATKKIFYEIKGYPITFSNNCFSLMQTEKNNKILLCSCKQYDSSQKNGILYLKIDTKKFENGEKIREYFYNTGSFQVLCFCPLFVTENNQIKNSDYFFVGGYENAQQKGMIKLFKIKYSENENSIDIQDIIIENGEESISFTKRISCIIQSKKTGDIVITSFDGNVYLCNSSNLKNFLQNKKFR
jgi:hypothetical protein